MRKQEVFGARAKAGNSSCTTLLQGNSNVHFSKHDILLEIIIISNYELMSADACTGIYHEENGTLIFIDKEAVEFIS
jgi:hypothetical protein